MEYREHMINKIYIFSHLLMFLQACMKVGTAQNIEKNQGNSTPIVKNRFNPKNDCKDAVIIPF
jgi:hypothetical protein